MTAAVLNHTKTTIDTVVLSCILHFGLLLKEWVVFLKIRKYIKYECTQIAIICKFCTQRGTATLTPLLHNSEIS